MSNEKVCANCARERTAREAAEKDADEVREKANALIEALAAAEATAAALRAELEKAREEVRTTLLAPEERRKLTGDALAAEAENTRHEAARRSAGDALREGEAAAYKAAADARRVGGKELADDLRTLGHRLGMAADAVTPSDAATSDNTANRKPEPTP